MSTKLNLTTLIAVVFAAFIGLSAPAASAAPLTKTWFACGTGGTNQAPTSNCTMTMDGTRKLEFASVENSEKTGATVYVYVAGVQIGTMNLTYSKTAITSATMDWTDSNNRNYTFKVTASAVNPKKLGFSYTKNR